MVTAICTATLCACLWSAVLIGIIFFKKPEKKFRPTPPRQVMESNESVILMTSDRDEQIEAEELED